MGEMRRALADLSLRILISLLTDELFGALCIWLRKHDRDERFRLLFRFLLAHDLV